VAHEFVSEVDSRKSFGLAIFSQALFGRRMRRPTTPYANSTYSPPTYSASNSFAMPLSNAVVLALNGQDLLLREMLEEHQKRAADFDARKKPNRKKAKNGNRTS